MVERGTHDAISGDGSMIVDTVKIVGRLCQVCADSPDNEVAVVVVVECTAAENECSCGGG